MSRLAVVASMGLLLGLLGPTARADTYSAGGADDPKLREADFLAADHRYLSALGELSAAQLDAPAASASTALLSRVADSSLEFGLATRAAELYSSVPLSGSELAQRQLRLAQFDYQRGRYDDAASHLAAARDPSIPGGGAAWSELSGLVLLAQGRAAEAASALASDDAPIARYNLAIAEFNEGKSLEARTTLEKLGREDAKDPESRAFRDKANLVLAYDYLKNGQGKYAVPIFQRVHSLGPYTNKALLGLGWAQLAPDQSDGGQDTSAAKGESGSLGTDIGGSAADKTGRNGALLNLEPGKGTPAQLAQFRKALVPWLELISRDPLDPTVQECTLAIPFALDRLGAFAQAQDYYQRAIEGFKKTQVILDESIARVSDGKMIEAIVRPSANNDTESGWSWQLKSLPDTPETFYLQNLIAENRFQEALKQYRDLLLLSARLDEWQGRLDKLKAETPANTSDIASLQSRIADLRPQIAEATPRARAKVEGFALDELKGQKALTDRYLIETRLALGRLYDRHIGAAQ